MNIQKASFLVLLKNLHGQGLTPFQSSCQIVQILELLIDYQVNNLCHLDFHFQIHFNFHKMKFLILCNVYVPNQLIVI